MHTLLFAPATHRLGPVLTLVEIALACRQWCNPVFITFGGRFSSVIRELGLALMELTPRLSPQRQQALIALERGEARGELFSPEELTSRVHSELEAYEATAAVGIVACSSLSPLISARAARLPLAWVAPLVATRAFWEGPSPRRAELFSGGRWLPEGVRAWAASRAMLRGRFVGPFNQVARAMGTPRASNLLSMAEGPRDIVVLCDPPQLCPGTLPPTYRTPGPIIPTHTPWQVPTQLTRSRPLVVLPSSSTPTPVLEQLLKCLAQGPWPVLAPIRSLMPPPFSSPTIHATSWIPALAVCRQARAVIACGGISSMYTAMASSRPVVVIPSWPLARVAGAVARDHGLATLLEPSRLSPQQLTAAVESAQPAAFPGPASAERISATLKQHFAP